MQSQSDTAQTGSLQSTRWSRRYLPLAIALLSVAGCNALPVAHSPVFAADESGTQQQHQHLDAESRSQLMYEIMIAELAGRRGYLNIAIEGYSSASGRTNDARVSERATRLSVYGRNWPVALESANRWKELDAENPEVFRILSQVHLRSGNGEAAADEMVGLIDLSDEPVDAVVEDLYTMLTREADSATALLAMRKLRDRLPEEKATNIAYARLAMSHSERQVALEAVEKALEIDPDSNEALIVRAQVLMSLGRGDEGLEQLDAAVKKNPSDVNLRLGLARLLVDAERYDEAEVEFEEIYTRAPDDPQAMFTIGLLGLESKRNAAAATYFEQLLTLGEYESEAHYYLARIADSQQKYEEAIEHYEQVVSGESLFDAQIRAAELYATTGDLEKGQERIAELRQSSNEAVIPRLIRTEARMLRDAGRDEESLEVLSAGLEQFPGDGNLRYTRALVAQRQGQDELFKEDLELLIETEPENAHAMNALGYHYAQTNTELEKAEQLLVDANRLLPQDPAILDSLGWLYYRLGRMDESLEYLRAAYAELKDPEIAAHLGEVLWITGEQDSARDIWDKALAETPDDTNLKSVVERFIQ